MTDLLILYVLTHSKRRTSSGQWDCWQPAWGGHQFSNELLSTISVVTMGNLSCGFFSSRYLLQSLSGRVCKHLTCREHFSIYVVSNWLQHELQELHGCFYSHSSSDKAMFDWKEESGDLHSIVQLSPYLLKNPLPSTPWLCCSVFQGEAPGGMGRRMVCFRAQGWRIN